MTDSAISAAQEAELTALADHFTARVVALSARIRTARFSEAERQHVASELADMAADLRWHLAARSTGEHVAGRMRTAADHLASVAADITGPRGQLPAVNPGQ
jgi:glycosyltransferase A (GT-A) superfamily protein (DUF2064 family)